MSAERVETPHTLLPPKATAIAAAAMLAFGAYKGEAALDANTEAIRADAQAEVYWKLDMEDTQPLFAARWEARDAKDERRGLLLQTGALIGGAALMGVSLAMSRRRD